MILESKFLIKDAKIENKMIYPPNFVTVSNEFMIALSTRVKSKERLGR